jgi:hypothetical protein
MSIWLWVATLLALSVGLAHSYLGERHILVRLLRRDNLPHLFGSDVFTKRTLRFAWHLTSIAWWGAAVTIPMLAREDASAGLRVIGGTFLVSAVVTAVGSRGRHLAWPVFLLIGAAAWLGAG